MKRLVVPTDFSVYATGAIALAAVIARKTKAPISLVHNIPTLLHWESMSEDQKQEYPEMAAQTHQAQTTLNELQRADVLKGTKSETAITHGVTYDQIVRYAASREAGMIVIGSHGNERSDRYFIGSNIQKVMRMASCPVLTAKKEFDGDTIHSIVFPSEFDEEAHRHFAPVAELARDLKSKVHLLSVNTPYDFADSRSRSRKLNAFREQYPDLTIDMMIHDHFDPESGILEYAEDIGADMIAMATSDRRNRARYRIGVTDSIVFHATIPVLSINAAIFHKAPTPVGIAT